MERKLFQLFSLVVFLASVMPIVSLAQIAPGTFQNPLMPGADPWLLYFDGNYYLSTTQGDAIRIWTAPTLAKLKTAAPVTVWKYPTPARYPGVWAPEFHFINHRWYLYYTAMVIPGSTKTHRIYVLESSGQNPLGPYAYKGRLVNPANDRYAIDPTVFQKPDGSLYLVWCADPGHVLYIARMANPWTLQGNGVHLPTSGFGCGRGAEGPEVLQHNGRLFLVYSTCDARTPDYKLGMLMANEDSDVLDPKSWQQYPKPVFERNDANGVFGPGHNGFFRSPDGKEDWIVYHAKTSLDFTYDDRTTRAQKFNWNTDGTPNFGTPLPLDAILNEPSGEPATLK